MLPTYCVSPLDGGFQANVTLVGLDFKCSSGGDLCSSPREAKESAALQMLVKLRSMAGQAKKLQVHNVKGNEGQMETEIVSSQSRSIAWDFVWLQ